MTHIFEIEGSLADVAVPTLVSHYRESHTPKPEFASSDVDPVIWNFYTRSLYIEVRPYFEPAPMEAYLDDEQLQKVGDGDAFWFMAHARVYLLASEINESDLLIADDVRHLLYAPAGMEAYGAVDAEHFVKRPEFRELVCSVLGDARRVLERVPFVRSAY